MYMATKIETIVNYTELKVCSKKLGLTVSYILILFIYMDVVPACACLVPSEGVGVTDSCESICGC